MNLNELNIQLCIQVFIFLSKKHHNLDPLLLSCKKALSFSPTTTLHSDVALLLLCRDIVQMHAWPAFALS